MYVLYIAIITLQVGVLGENDNAENMGKGMLKNVIAKNISSVLFGYNL